MDLIQEGLVILMMVLMGAYSIKYFLDGWLMVRKKKIVLLLDQRFQLFWVTVFWGSNVAEGRKKEMLSPEINRKSGVWALLNAMFALFIFLFILFFEILRVIGSIK